MNQIKQRFTVAKSGIVYANALTDNEREELNKIQELEYLMAIKVFTREVLIEKYCPHEIECGTIYYNPW
jgi:hypothetical protein